jgi:hypothetical protein
MVKFDQEKILSLVNDRVKEKILLPEIQRKFVWKPKKILDLIDSLWKDYPIGSLLIWKTEEEIETKNFEDGKENLGRKYNEKHYLLDGQQRLTALVLSIEKSTIMFDLVDEKFVLERKPLKKDQRYIYLSNLFIFAEKEYRRATWEELEKVLEKRGYIDKDERISNLKKLVKIQEIFEKDISLIIVDKSRRYDDVAEIFIRINSKGVYITKQDLAYSKITLAVPGISRARINPSIAQFERSGFPFNAGFLVKLIVAIETGQTKSMLSEEIWKEEMKRNLNERWDNMVDSLKQALDFLKKVGITNGEEITSENLILLIAYSYSLKLPIDEEPIFAKKLKYFVFSAMLWARYSGSSESVVDRDLKALKEKKSVSAVEEIIKDNERDERKITPEIFRTHSKNSPAFKIYYLYMKSKLGEYEISKDVLYNLNKKEDHHIFPKKLLKKQGLDDNAINDICNLTFISKKRNLNILAKDPEVYLADLWNKQGEEFFDNHLIPKDRELWKLKSYNKFIEERRRIISEQIKSFFDDMRR